MKKNKRTSRNEFRYNYNYRHTHYVFEEDDNKYHSVGLTHHNKTKDKNNMPLTANPKKNHTEKAYARYGIISDKKQNYSGIDKRFKFSKEDKRLVNSKIRNYKRKRKNK